MEQTFITRFTLCLHHARVLYEDTHAHMQSSSYFNNWQLVAVTGKDEWQCTTTKSKEEEDCRLAKMDVNNEDLNVQKTCFIKEIFNNTHKVSWIEVPSIQVLVSNTEHKHPQVTLTFPWHLHLGQSTMGWSRQTHTQTHTSLCLADFTQWRSVDYNLSCRAGYESFI